MRWMLVLIGVLTLLGGVWPLISGLNFIPPWVKFIPASGVAYQIIIIVIGVIAIVYGVRHKNTLR